MRVNIDSLIQAKDTKSRAAILDNILLKAQDDPIFMTDLLLEWGKSEMILQSLRQDDEEKYILYVLCDEWGRQVYPGDIVKLRKKNSLERADGALISVDELNLWKAQGTYDQRRYTYKKYKVDEKGCITVNALHAEQFLKLHGYNANNRKGICIHYPKNTSSEPVDYILDGVKQEGKRHVHYWRYEEKTKEDWETMPDKVRPKDDKGKNNV